MAKDKEIIEAMNLIKNHCKGRMCLTCACWNDTDNNCIVFSNTEPSLWETDKAKIVE